MIPETIKIFGHTFQCELVDPGIWGDEGMGRSSIMTGTISVHSGMPEDVILSTFIHEAIHMALDILSINADEQTISAAAAVALEVYNALNQRDSGRLGEDAGLPSRNRVS